MRKSSSTSSLFVQAASLEAAGCLGDAERLYRGQLAADPGHHAVWHSLGLLAFNTQRLPLATQCLKAAIALDGRTALYHRYVGEMYRRLGRPEWHIYPD